MKKDGPPRKPTALKVIEGTFRADRANANEAKPEIALPDVPSHLSAEAKEEWVRVSSELYQLGLLSRIDRAALGAYCECWADWVDATRRCVGPDGKDLKVIKTGERFKYDSNEKLIERSGGNYIENPYFTIKKRTVELMHKFLTEFGMTPASRSRIDAEPPKANGADPARKYFG